MGAIGDIAKKVSGFIRKIELPKSSPPPQTPATGKPRDTFEAATKPLVDLGAARGKPMMMEPKAALDLISAAQKGISGIVDQVKELAANYDPKLAGVAGLEGVILTGTTWLEQHVPVLGPVADAVDKLFNRPPAAVAWPNPPPAVSANPPLTTGPVYDANGKPTTPMYQSTDGIQLYGPPSPPAPPADPKVPAQVAQGQLGDCYFMASLAGLSPAEVKDMIKDNQDGTYTVRLYDVDSSGNSKPVFVRVTGDLPDPSAANYGPDGKWAAIVEKAYATQVGSYDIASGDKNPKFFAAPTVLTGRPTVAYALSVNGTTVSSPDVVYQRLTQAVAEGRPAFAGFYGAPQDGVLGDHAYTVVGTRTDPATGQRYVTVRNPWGNTEPNAADGTARDGKNDGVFELPLEDFMKTYQAVAVAGG